MNKKYFCRICCALMTSILLLLPCLTITASAQKVAPKDDYPYNDNEKFRYTVEGHPDIASGWSGSNYVLAYEITIWDNTQMVPKILSVDDYVITIKNLPKPATDSDANKETTYIFNEKTKPGEVSTVSYTTSYKISSFGNQTDPDANWQSFMQSPTVDGKVEGRVGKHRALFDEHDAGGSVNSGRNWRYQHGVFGSVAVQLEGIVLPKTMLYLYINWSADTNYYLGYHWDDKTGNTVNEDKLPGAKALHAQAVESAKAYAGKFSNVSYEIKKTPHLTEASARNDALEVSFIVLKLRRPMKVSMPLLV